MATDKVKKVETKVEHGDLQTASTGTNERQTRTTAPAKAAVHGMSGGLLAFVICSFIVGGCNVITALYYTMKSLFLGWNDYTSILSAVVSIVMAVCFIMAAVEMTGEKKDGKRLGEVALIVALVCSIITAIPGIIDGFPRQRATYYDSNSSSSWQYEVDYGYDSKTAYSGSGSETLAAERALYVVTWVMIFVVRTGLVGLLIAYLEKSERVKNTLVK